MTVEIILAVACVAQIIVVIRLVAIKAELENKVDFLEFDKEAISSKCRSKLDELERELDITSIELKEARIKLQRLKTKDYRFINISTFTSNDALNRTVKEYQTEGYTMVINLSTDRLLVFKKFGEEESNKED